MPDPTAPPATLIEHLNRGDCVLFVGDALDGVSQSARLAAALVDRCDAHCEFCQADRRCSRPQACIVPLARAAQLFEKRHSRYALQDFVGRYVEEHYPPRPVLPVYQALAGLPARVIVTTAYDDRLEAALEAAGRRYLQVVKDTDVPFDDPGRVQLIRLHGAIRDRERLVLTENDAADLFARLPVVTKVLQGHFASKTLLFVGYRLGEPYFLSLHRQVTAPIARSQRPVYAVQWPPDAQAADRWRGEITLLDAEPLPFLTQLTRSIRVQKEEAKRVVLPPEPYKFLDYYTEKDAAIFFGRDLEADLLLSTVLAHELTVFYGRSGTGKTSLLLARVVPALEKEGYRVAYARMLGDPASEIKAAVLSVRADQLSPSVQARSLRAVLADALPPAGRLVIVLDQFEEFFIRQGEAVRQAFAQELADCLWPTSPPAPLLRGEGSMTPFPLVGGRAGDGGRSPSPLSPLPGGEGNLDIRFVLSLRDDYLGALDELSAILPHDVFAHRYRLENLTREKALLAILKPAAAFGLPVEESLREQLIQDLEDQGLEPANLQIVLYRLYRDALAQGLWTTYPHPHPSPYEGEGSAPSPRRGDTLAGAGGRGEGRSGLTLARYHALGGTQAILAGYLDEVLAALPPAQQPGARVILKSMVTAQKTKAAVSGQEVKRGDLVARLGLTEADLDRLLAHLRERRVVRKFGDEDRYELAHEVLVEKVWAWVSDEELHLLDVRDMLRRAMGDYEKFHHLLTPEKLKLVMSCCDVLALSDAELELLCRSALAVGYEVPYWFDRARAGGVNVDEIALAGLKSDAFRARAAAVAALGQLGDRFAEAIIEMLADAYPQVRVAAIRALERLRPTGEWRTHLRYECYVPAGPFLMGNDKSGHSDERPAHEVTLAAFYIGKYPVTNADYKRYKDDVGQPFDIPKGKENHPVVEVSWYDARDYAAWAGLRLLTEAEWEKAARGGREILHIKPQSPSSKPQSPNLGLGVWDLGFESRQYPWGDEFDRWKCNTSEAGIGDTTPVGRYSPAGDSPYGCADMAGNVWEWTSSVYKPYPYRADDGREDLSSSASRVQRGGSFDDDASYARCACRDHYAPDDRWLSAGVRCGWGVGGGPYSGS